MPCRQSHTNHYSTPNQRYHQSVNLNGTPNLPTYHSPPQQCSPNKTLEQCKVAYHHPDPITHRTYAYKSNISLHCFLFKIWLHINHTALLHLTACLTNPPVSLSCNYPQRFHGNHHELSPSLRQGATTHPVSNCTYLFSKILHFTSSNQKHFGWLCKLP